MTEVASAIARIRKFVRTHPGMTLGRFARIADLHRNTLYGLHEKSWNPTAETLNKCLAAIDKTTTEEPPKRGKKNPNEAAAAA